MLRTKKGFNWKARQVVETTIDNSQTKKISVDLKGVRPDAFDDCNALVLPSEKRKTKKKSEADIVKRFLSKKQRKRLQQIVDRKKKKENRASLLEALTEVKAEPELLAKLVSIAQSQTKGLKRLHDEEKQPDDSADSSQPKRISSVAGSKKRRMLLSSGSFSETSEKNPNVVGFEESSSGSDDDDDDDDDDEQEGGEEVEESENEDSCAEMDRGKKETEKEETDKEKVADERNSSDSDGKRREDSSSSKAKQNLGSKKDNPVKKPVQEKKEPVVRCPAVFVPVIRPPGVQEARMKLPVLAEEQVIMEAISENDVVVIAGETGSGKTTQVPQFLYEAGYARDGKMIGITEPRRVAAISMSQRVSYEMGLGSEEVSYLIRYEGNVSEKTRIKFMTDGVLLKEIQRDFILSKYSVILLDEAHERSVYTDILLGLLSRIVPLRRKRGFPLKLVIMSATLRLQDFTENTRLFRVPPPVIKVESRQYPVTIHFNKRTREDYVREAFSKACKIHSQLPEGGILIFLTGQQEVKSLVRKLRKAFPYRPLDSSGKMSEVGGEDKDCDSDDDIPRKKLPKGKKHEEIPLPTIDLDEFPVVPGGEDDEDELALDDEEEDKDMEEMIKDPKATRQPLWVLPLYSLLTNYKQTRVFQPAPPGCRLCVVATNVAETSLTIPSVRYVVDCGKEKKRRYDKVTGVSAFVVDWTSKASANQRAGRAGRTGPGHCYRLYSSAIFNDEFEVYSIPEMQRKPVDDLVLQMKSMGIHKVVNFPFPSPPGLMQLQTAEKRLSLLGALRTPEGKAADDWVAQITPLGKSMAAFPVAPRFAKMLALSHQQGLLPYAVCMVAALSVPEILLENPQNKSLAATRRAWAGTGQSLLLGDPTVLMRAVGAAEHAGTQGDLQRFCEEHGLRHKAVVEVRKLRLQLTAEVNMAVPGVDLVVDPQMKPPTEEQARLLRQLLLAGLGDQVGRRVDPASFKDKEDQIKWKNGYRCSELEEPVRIHPTSVLRREYPEWVVYQEVFETGQQKLYMRGITAIEAEWLPVFVPDLCNLSPPMLEPPPRYDVRKDQLLCHVSGTFGRAGWGLPVVEVDFPPGLDRYKWFSVFFLDGTLFPCLKKYVEHLLSTPASMTKSWARLQPRTEVLLKTLIGKQVDSREKILEQWKADRTYLLSAYQKWVPESLYNEVALLWPPK